MSLPQIYYIDGHSATNTNTRQELKPGALNLRNVSATFLVSKVFKTILGSLFGFNNSIYSFSIFLKYLYTLLILKLI